MYKYHKILISKKLQDRHPVYGVMIPIQSLTVVTILDELLFLCESTTFLSAPCPKPTVENGYIKVYSAYSPPNDTFVRWNTYIEFGCDDGYTIYYTPERKYTVCLPNGNWDQPIPSCILQGNAPCILL